jgi:hypothetical protein
VANVTLALSVLTPETYAVEIVHVIVMLPVVLLYIVTASPFENVAKPLMKWLCDNKHPHTTAIVTGNVAELVEGVETVKTDEFIVD